ncbi:alpha/beta hydrolase family esterase [Corynebacterium pseudopelargi]|uniref:Phospholipase/Carboxylesterase n=1 Tax=Corynebacterium pseudopelargi TaxID=2080757 RepID=A0A3G6ISC4_9CORY|nr:poly(3-hydroxyalkanoate) depolymerase [Corynebacterium pseudopelargi]AZA08486.1 Phospholipase/Carboxylesterase [Corynebacterium pseudopelargi]
MPSLAPLERHRLGHRQYRLLRPTGAPSGDLLRALHGSKQSGSVFQRFSAGSFDRFAALGWTICYPDAVAQHWNDDRVHLNERTRTLGTDDVGFLKALIAHLQPQRVAAVGFSNGAMMVFSLLYRRPGLINAAALLSATHPAADNWRCDAKDFLPTPLFCQHGMQDSIVPFGGGNAGMPGQDRGELLGFDASCEKLASLNRARLIHGGTPRRYEGQAPLEAWALPGEGHVIPSLHPVTSPLLGPASGTVDIAVHFEQFLFSLDDAAARTH